VLRRKFDPDLTLSDAAQHRARTLVVVPVMLHRILELGEEAIRKYDLGALRTIDVSGSALPGELALRVMDAFGDVLYNLYGSTEVAWATIATPEDLRAAPGTPGRPPRNTVVKLFDENGKEVSKGETGRIFVGNEMQFEGYTGGGNKDLIDGLMSSGDVGHFDEGGRPVRRRPRRRDDRLGRRERLPARGRGPARGAPEHRRGGGHRRRGPEFGQASRLRSGHDGRLAERGRPSRPTSRRT
jgi:acyl-coenzyme A synthetase/AMP-(fatty) acid ligase